MKRSRFLLLTVVVALGLLTIPLPEAPVPSAPPGGRGFAWSRDEFWRSLEAAFLALRDGDCGTVIPDATSRIGSLDGLLVGLNRHPPAPSDAVLDHLERDFFELAPLVAACPGFLPEYVRLQGALRATVKHWSGAWDIARPDTRSRLYRSLYGSRAAVEEVLLHHQSGVPALLVGVPESSATPSVLVRGVRIHSGDLLVSRGGYPTSALIARGNDYPGNFSHVALVHVDSAGTASTVEAHIERGVTIATPEQYLGDKKLRIMVLRLRADLPSIRADPLLPHRAATLAMERARAGHIRYDFTMDYSDPSKLFCSEVASSAYRAVGVTLWTGLSTISRPGLRRWLASFGVRHFTTQEPSDLEYDPQLVVVAEWRDPAALRSDHIDNAVTDAMLEGADAGEELTYPWYHLAPARLAKGYSWVQNRLDRIGPVPEGMSARAALRNAAYTARHHRLAAVVTEQANRLGRERGYPPPYWTLVDLARQAARAEARPTAPR